MRFSPAGGGKQVLVLAESADFIHVLDGNSFDRKQTFDFFGEIGGLSFVPDGSKFFVANSDPGYGGLMEFERADYGGVFGTRSRQPNVVSVEQELRESNWKETNGWLGEGELSDDFRVVTSRNGMELGNLVS